MPCGQLSTVPYVLAQICDASSQLMIVVATAVEAILRSNWNRESDMVCFYWYICCSLCAHLNFRSSGLVLLRCMSR